MRLLKDENKKEVMVLKAQIKSLSSQNEADPKEKEKLEAEYQRGLEAGKNEVIEACKTKLETIKNKANIKYEEMKQELETVKAEKEQIILKSQKFVQQVREREVLKAAESEDKEKESANKEEQVKALLKDLYRLFKDQVQESNQYSGTEVLALIRKVLQEEAAKKKINKNNLSQKKRNLVL